VEELRWTYIPRNDSWMLENFELPYYYPNASINKVRDRYSVVIHFRDYNFIDNTSRGLKEAKSLIESVIAKYIEEVEESKGEGWSYGELGRVTDLKRRLR
jgi:hypothetical protein